MRARYPVLIGLSAALGLWAASAMQPVAAGVGDASKSGVETRSLLGSYLAGRVARGQHDTETAATYYREALVRDPGNDVLI
jgi:hypothetical protein